MPAYNFKKEFAAKVEAETKRQTIRKPRKRPTVVGDILHLYTGIRTKKCRRLLPPVACHCVFDVLITEKGARLDDYVVKEENLNTFARRDGFESWDEMKDFFEKQYGLPFEGKIICW